MKKLIIALLIIFILISCLIVLVSCNKEINYEKEVNVFYLNEEYNTKVKLKVNNNIAYISYEDFIPLLFRGRNINEGRDKFTIEKDGNKFIITPSNGMVGIFDVKENTFETENFSLFKNVHFLEGGMEGVVSYDGLPFIKVDSVEVDKDPDKMFIDFDDYSIDIFAEDDSLYIPINTLSNMYSGMNLIVCEYNGFDVYIYCYIENETLNDFDKSVCEGIAKQKYTQSLIDFNYNNLCLNFDYFIGHAGRCAYDIYFGASTKLDSALESDEFGKTIKAYLKSSDLMKYFAGKDVLSQLLHDGGHTYFTSYFLMSYTEDGEAKYPEWLNNHNYSIFSKHVDDILKHKTDIMDKLCDSYYHEDDIYRARKEILGKSEGELFGEETYTIVGDTAIIHIDGFLNEINNLHAWNDYYNGKTDNIPFDKQSGGAVGALYYGLIKANEDEVKRIIIDLSANSGGSLDEMMYVISILTNKANIDMYDHVTNQVCKTNYLIDRNLDRVFDEKDAEFDLIGDKELAILTSQNAFSCGGISSVLLSEYGVYTIGDNCGGGSCAIYFQSDAYGLTQISSSPYQFLDINGIDFDKVRETICDTKLEIGIDEETNKYDFSAFYDIENLNKLIDEHYSKVVSE